MGAPTAGGSPPPTPSPGQSPSNPITPTGLTPGGSPILPVGCSGSGCGSNPWRFFDPPVAIGFNYQLQSTVPNQPLTFGITGIMVTSKVGSGVYDLWLYDTLTSTFVDSKNFSSTGETITIAADPTADPKGAFNVVQFLLSLTPQEEKVLGITDPDLGLTEFSLRGIDPAAGLDPEDPNAFITGLTFGGDVNGDLVITPLAVDSATGELVDPPPIDVPIPEPSTIAILLSALAAAGVLRGAKGR
jgi:PEP-CTERM motif-containing protein